MITKSRDTTFFKHFLQVHISIPWIILNQFIRTFKYFSNKWTNELILLFQKCVEDEGNWESRSKTARKSPCLCMCKGLRAGFSPLHDRRLNANRHLLNTSSIGKGLDYRNNHCSKTSWGHTLATPPLFLQGWGWSKSLHNESNLKAEALSASKRILPPLLRWKGIALNPHTMSKIR